MVRHNLSEEVIHVHVGEPVEIAVRSGGANGYAWSVRCDPSTVDVVEHKRQPDRESFGGRGSESFVVQLTEKGRAELEFTLRAPWESEPEERHELVLDGSD